MCKNRLLVSENHLEFEGLILFGFLKKIVGAFAVRTSFHGIFRLLPFVVYEGDKRITFARSPLYVANKKIKFLMIHPLNKENGKHTNFSSSICLASVPIILQVIYPKRANLRS